LELGVLGGESLRMWAEYFGWEAGIVGIDENTPIAFANSIQCLQHRIADH